MKFSDLQNTQLLSSEDEKYYVNHTTDTLIFLEKFDGNIFVKWLKETEEIYRRGIYETFITPSKTVINEPLVGRITRMKADDTWIAFKGTKVAGKTGENIKYSQWTSAMVFKDHFVAEGIWPLKKTYTYKDRTTEPRPKLRLTNGDPSLSQLLSKLSTTSKKQMLFDIILNPQSRKNMSDRSFGGNFRADFKSLTEDFKNLKAHAAKEKFTKNFEIFFNSKKDKPGITPTQRAFCLTLLRAANLQKIVLPSLFFRNNTTPKITSVFLLNPLLIPKLIEIYIPKSHHNEYKFANKYIKSHFSHDNVLADAIYLFCCSNYGSSSDFKIEPFSLLRSAFNGEDTTLTRPHGLNVYAKACLQFHNIKGQERINAETIISSRLSATLIRKNPFAFLLAKTREEAVVYKVQLSNFEKKVGIKVDFPVPKYISDWINIVDEQIANAPSKTHSKYINAAVNWFAYLYILGEVNAPTSFENIIRLKHVNNLNDPAVMTFRKVLTTEWMLEPLGSMKSISQLFDLWKVSTNSTKQSPFEQRIDWKNPSKKLRTHRRAMPSLMIETLIEENAKPDKSGNPYQLIKSNIWGKGNPITHPFKSKSGKTVSVEFPLPAAVIDLILHFGMRSGSARWLDTGQGDEFKVDLNQTTYTKNTLPEATNGRRSGFVQILDLGPNNSIMSLHMEVNKTKDTHEIPYLPQDLAERLNYIKDLQEKYNPISAPILGVDASTKFTRSEDHPLIYPLFRDPRNANAAPISRERVALYWKKLLEITEPIFNKKRKEIYGEDTQYYKFFDLNGTPKWDIHSIRVAVVTALLEQGVPPTIVQLLAGHSNLIMTLHYEAVDNFKTHEAISTAFEERRQQAIIHIQSADNEEELERGIDQLIGGCLNAADSEALDLAKENVETFGSLHQAPGGFSVFSHGICPGGECSKGGEKKSGTYFPVHRDKACSRCRFRITGPAFLEGLTLSANIIMSEIHAITEKEREINAEILKKAENGEPIAWLESRKAQEVDLKDNLWADWAAEFTAIQECLKMTAKQNDSNSAQLPAFPTDLSYSLSNKHHLSLLNTITKKSKLLTGANIDIPTGLREQRNEMLYQIAEKNNLSQWLFALPTIQRQTTLDEFANMLEDLEDSLLSDGTDPIQDLIAGIAQIPDRKNFFETLSENIGDKLYLEETTQ
ncbi:MAG: tyrosine-type recombinase/integrase [Sneathiella sp.]|nr:tyrosine-type recombinase/integrase [Sneathiella sp.]